MKSLDISRRPNKKIVKKSSTPQYARSDKKHELIISALIVFVLIFGILNYYLPVLLPSKVDLSSNTIAPETANKLTIYTARTNELEIFQLIKHLKEAGFDTTIAKKELIDENKIYYHSSQSAQILKITEILKDEFKNEEAFTAQATGIIVYWK